MIALFFFFFNDTATTEIYTLSLHDALPIWPPPKAYRSPASSRRHSHRGCRPMPPTSGRRPLPNGWIGCRATRSEEHTSELQSRLHLVCRLLLEKKKKQLALTSQRRSTAPAH